MHVIFKNSLNKFKKITYIKNINNKFSINSIKLNSNLEFNIDTSILNEEELLEINYVKDISSIYGAYSVEFARALSENAFVKNRDTITACSLTNIFKDSQDRKVFYFIKLLSQEKEYNYYGVFGIPDTIKDNIENYIDSKINSFILNIE